MSSKPTEMLPIDLKAEAAVLGSLLIDPDVIYRVRPLVTPDDFSSVKHQLVFSAVLYLVDEAMPVDMVTMGKVLRDKVTDAELTALLGATPTSIHAEHYAGLVRAARIQRDLIYMAANLTKEAHSANGNLPDVTAAARKALADAERLMLNGLDGLNLRQSCDFYLDLLERRERERDIKKLEFPWRDLSPMMPYLDGGTLAAILAEPGVGKTAFMENCAEAWAKNGWRVAFFHLELSKEMMLDRRMQRHSGVPIRRLQLGGQLEPDEYQKILDALAKINHWPGNVQYIHCPGWTMANIIATAQKLNDADRLDVVVIDYLNKVKFVQRGDMNAAQSRGQDIEDFKTALEVNGWVGLMAGQFDKASKQAKRKTLGNARDTGELEDKANVGIIIDRPYEGYDSNKRSQTANVIVDKCNAGQTGAVKLFYKGDRLAFYDVQRQAA